MYVNELSDVMHTHTLTSAYFSSEKLCVRGHECVCGVVVHFCGGKSIEIENTNLIADVLRYHAFLLFYSFHIFGILPSKLWCQRNDNGRYPHEKYHQRNATSGSRVNIINIRDRPISEIEAINLIEPHFSLDANFNFHVFSLSRSLLLSLSPILSFSLDFF